MRPKKNDIVTVVDNKTGKEYTGKVITYTPNTIRIVKEFNSRIVHFKKEE